VVSTPGQVTVVVGGHLPGVRDRQSTRFRDRRFGQWFDHQVAHVIGEGPHRLRVVRDQRCRRAQPGLRGGGELAGLVFGVGEHRRVVDPPGRQAGQDAAEADPGLGAGESQFGSGHGGGQVERAGPPVVDTGYGVEAQPTLGGGDGARPPAVEGSRQLHALWKVVCGQPEHSPAGLGDRVGDGVSGPVPDLSDDQHDVVSHG
jgi:hypothetical protein